MIDSSDPISPFDSSRSPSTQAFLSGDQGGEVTLKHNVLLVVNPDFSHLLDFNRGRFYALDAMGTVMLRRVLGQPIAQGIEAIAQEYQTAEATIKTDLTELLQSLEQQQLIAPRQSNASSFPPYQSLVGQLSHWLSPLSRSILRVISHQLHLWLDQRSRPQSGERRFPSQRTVGLLLSASWLSFRYLGWSRTLKLWQDWHRSKAVEPFAYHPLDPQTIIAAVDQLVREGAAWHWILPMVCKERALVAYHILRVYYGLPATLVVGIDHYPFHLHAWVEYHGKVVSDDGDRCRLFTPIISYGQGCAQR